MSDIEYTYLKNRNFKTEEMDFLVFSFLSESSSIVNIRANDYNYSKKNLRFFLFFILFNFLIFFKVTLGTKTPFKLLLMPCICLLYS